MARRVWKYPLRFVASRQEVEMPYGASIVHVHEQRIGGFPAVVLWAEVDAAAPRQLRAFYAVATGESIPPEARRYVGTVHVSWEVWHVYEDPYRHATTEQTGATELDRLDAKLRGRGVVGDPQHSRLHVEEERDQ
jgi:hypothetical protein